MAIVALAVALVAGGGPVVLLILLFSLLIPARSLGWPSAGRRTAEVLPGPSLRFTRMMGIALLIDLLALAALAAGIRL